MKMSIRHGALGTVDVRILCSASSFVVRACGSRFWWRSCRNHSWSPLPFMTRSGQHGPSCVRDQRRRRAEKAEVAMPLAMGITSAERHVCSHLETGCRNQGNATAAIRSSTLPGRRTRGKSSLAPDTPRSGIPHQSRRSCGIELSSRDRCCRSAAL